MGGLNRRLRMNHTPETEVCPRCRASSAKIAHSHCVFYCEECGHSWLEVITSPRDDQRNPEIDNPGPDKDRSRLGYAVNRIRSWSMKAGISNEKARVWNVGKPT